MSDPEKYIEVPLFNEDQNFEQQAQNENRQRVAFGRYVKPEMYDIFGEHDLEGLSETEKSWMSAEKLRELVLSPQRDDKFLVDGVLLNTFEYNLIVRSPLSLGKFASARVLHDNDLDNDRVEASKRAPIHVLEQKIAGMQVHGDKLAAQKIMLRELEKEVETPGYAHKTPERMSQLIAAAWNEFTIILDVIHLQRGWDDRKRQRAESTLINYLTQGGQRQRVSNWDKTLTVADNYLVQRTLLFKRKLQIAQDELNKYRDLSEEPTE